MIAILPRRQTAGSARRPPRGACSQHEHVPVRQAASPASELHGGVRNGCRASCHDRLRANLLAGLQGVSEQRVERGADRAGCAPTRTPAGPARGSAPHRARRSPGLMPRRADGAPRPHRCACTNGPRSRFPARACALKAPGAERPRRSPASPRISPCGYRWRVRQPRAAGARLSSSSRTPCDGSERRSRRSISAVRWLTPSSCTVAADPRLSSVLACSNIVSTTYSITQEGAKPSPVCTVLRPACGQPTPRGLPQGEHVRRHAARSRRSRTRRRARRRRRRSRLPSAGRCRRPLRYLRAGSAREHLAQPPNLPRTLGDEALPAKAGVHAHQGTWSTTGSTSSMAARGVLGLIATLARRPREWRRVAGAGEGRPPDGS